MGVGMILQGVGTAISAVSTIAGGNNAAAMGAAQKNAAYAQAEQLRAQEGTAIGAAQREMLDTQAKAKMLMSTVRANAAAGGVNAAEGSPLQVTQQIAKRGSYQAAMDLWQGQNKAVGLENESTSLKYGGDVAEAAGKMEQQASLGKALATIAGGGASMYKTYGRSTYGGISASDVYG